MLMTRQQSKPATATEPASIDTAGTCPATRLESGHKPASVSSESHRSIVEAVGSGGLFLSRTCRAFALPP